MSYIMAVSVSIGEINAPEGFEQRIHMISLEDVPLSQAEAGALQEAIVRMVCNITQISSGKTVFAVYKAEGPGPEMVVQ